MFNLLSRKKIQLLLYFNKKLIHCKSTTLWLLLILRWIRLLAPIILKSLVRPQNDGNVVLVANVLEEEASFDDVDLNEAIEDKTPSVEVRGTCCGGVSTTN